MMRPCVFLCALVLTLAVSVQGRPSRRAHLDLRDLIARADPEAHALRNAVLRNAAQRNADPYDKRVTYYYDEDAEEEEEDVRVPCRVHKTDGKLCYDKPYGSKCLVPPNIFAKCLTLD